MLLPFFTALRDAKVPVSMKEWLHLMEAMDRDVAGREVEAFYHLSRAVSYTHLTLPTNREV